MKSHHIDLLDQFGRPFTRLMTGLVCTIIGLSVGAAFVNWGFFHHAIPEVPGTSLLAPALPFAYQAWDNWVRQNGKNTVVQAAAAYPTSVNPHGGPDAP